MLRVIQDFLGFSTRVSIVAKLSTVLRSLIDGVYRLLISKFARLLTYTRNEG